MIRFTLAQSFAEVPFSVTNASMTELCDMTYVETLGTFECKLTGDTPVTVLIDNGSQSNLLSSGLYKRIASRLTVREIPPNQLGVKGMMGHQTGVLRVASRQTCQLERLTPQGISM